jgi:hypothetical protein
MGRNVLAGPRPGKVVYRQSLTINSNCLHQNISGIVMINRIGGQSNLETL